MVPGALILTTPYHSKFFGLIRGWAWVSEGRLEGSRDGWLMFTIYETAVKWSTR